MTQEGVIVKSKEVFYRGQNVEDLKKLDVREFAKHLPSRSRRYILRNFQKVEDFVKRCEAEAQNPKKKIKTHHRDIVIVPRLVGLKIGIYNGRDFHEVEIKPQMIGHRLGEFSLTRTPTKHGSAGIGATKGSASKKK